MARFRGKRSLLLGCLYSMLIHSSRYKHEPHRLGARKALDQALARLGRQPLGGIIHRTETQQQIESARIRHLLARRLGHIWQRRQPLLLAHLVLLLPRGDGLLVSRLFTRDLTELVRERVLFLREVGQGGERVGERSREGGRGGCLEGECSRGVSKRSGGQAADGRGGARARRRG